MHRIWYVIVVLMAAIVVVDAGTMHKDAMAAPDVILPEGYYLLQANEAKREHFLSYKNNFANAMFRGVFQGILFGVGRIILTVSIAALGFGILGLPGVFLFSIPQGIIISVTIYYFLLRGGLQLDSDKGVVFHLEHVEGTDGKYFILSTAILTKKRTRTKYIGGNKVTQNAVAMRAKEAPGYRPDNPKVFIRIITDYKRSGWLRSRKLFHRVQVNKEKATSWTLIRQAGLKEDLELV